MYFFIYLKIYPNSDPNSDPKLILRNKVLAFSVYLLRRDKISFKY